MVRFVSLFRDSIHDSNFIHLGVFCFDFGCVSFVHSFLSLWPCISWERIQYLAFHHFWGRSQGRNISWFLPDLLWILSGWGWYCWFRECPLLRHSAWKIGKQSDHQPSRKCIIRIRYFARKIPQFHTLSLSNFWCNTPRFLCPPSSFFFILGGMVFQQTSGGFCSFPSYPCYPQVAWTNRAHQSRWHFWDPVTEVVATLTATTNWHRAYF